MMSDIDTSPFTYYFLFTNNRVGYSSLTSTRTSAKFYLAELQIGHFRLPGYKPVSGFS